MLGSLDDLLERLSRSRYRYVEVEKGDSSVRVKLGTSSPRRADGEGARADALEAMEDAKIPESAGRRIRASRVGFFFCNRTKDGKLVHPKGSRISEGDVFGYIEAMHLKYEVKADRDGVIAAYLVEDGQGVEYGQPLLELE